MRLGYHYSKFALITIDSLAQKQEEIRTQKPEKKR